MIKSREDALFFSRPEIGNDAQVPENSFVIDYFDKGKKHYGVVATTILGPAIAYKFNDQHSVGIFTNLRVFGSLQNLPAELGYYQYNPYPDLQDLNLSAFMGAAISWKELGLNYALKLPTASGSMAFGINLKFLTAMEGAFLNSETDIRHQKLQTDIRLYDSPKFSFGYTNSNLQGNDYEVPQNNGSGFATDLGFTYWVEGNQDNYQLKLGASIMDLGFLNFNKNAIEHLIELDSTVTIDANDYPDYNDLEDFNAWVEQLSRDAYGDANRSVNGSDFQVLMPAAFSLQADYAFHPNFYLNGLLIQRIPFKGVTAARGNLFAITPRFEHRWLSASLPISVYNWQNLNVGLAARLAFLVIGTDNLGSWISKSNWTGTDFYVALKINFADLAFGGGGRSYSHKRRRGGGKVKCYDF